MNNAFDSVNVNSVYEIKVKINTLRDKLQHNVITHTLSSNIMY